MIISIGRHRGTIPVFYEENGKKFVQWIQQKDDSIEIPDGVKLLDIGDLIEPASKELPATDRS